MDPPTPVGGFPIKEVLDKVVVYSDGYRTMVDVRYPDDAKVKPPMTGWPGLMVVHGGGGTRKIGKVARMAVRMAKQGYVTIAYDTGSNGATKALNNPSDRPDDLRMRDIAEMFVVVERRLGAIFDDTRLAVSGNSGGGKHALWAASYSGRTLPTTSAWVTKGPRISAAVCGINVLDRITDHVPQGRMINAKWATGNWDKGGTNNPIVKLMVAGNYAALVRFLQRDPGFAFLPLLRASDVPLLISYAYDDFRHWINLNADTFPTLKPGVPRRYYQGTGGHRSPQNDVESQLDNDASARWCDRFLKGLKNGIDIEPFAEIAVVPADPAEYLHPKSHWLHRNAKAWPPTGPWTSLYLRTGGKLSPTSPSQTEAGPTIRHRLNGYTMIDFMKDGAQPTKVLNKVPLVSANFDEPPQKDAREIFGRTIVEVDITSSRSNFQLQAALFDVPPQGTPRFITSGVTATTNAAGRVRVRIELGDVCYVLPGGHGLRVALQNFNLKQQPRNSHFYVAPYFEDVDLQLHIDTTFPPRADVPFRRPHLSLTPRIGTGVSSDPAGLKFSMAIEGQKRRAGELCWLLIGASGTAPGILIPIPNQPALHLQLNFDSMTFLGIQFVNTPLFGMFLQRLDKNGDGKAEFRVPASVAPVLAGMRLAFAALGFDAQGGATVTNPVEFLVDPIGG